MQIGQGGNNSGNNAGGQGSLQIGERIIVHKRPLSVIKELGEGAFSFVYLVQDEVDKRDRSSSSIHDDAFCAVLKITSINSREQRDIAEKEAALLRRLKHPNIVEMFDYSYRTVPQQLNTSLLSSVVGGNNAYQEKPPRTQHMILMEYCEDGHGFDVMQTMEARRQRFSLNSLIVAFGQICNAVSYLHAQKPAICHRDLKPNNFLVNDGIYKLCDFGSAVFGDVELKSQLDRAEAEEVIQKTTTQMFRAPEMVDLYMSDRLTKSVDVWALGCCLYTMAFFQNCFEEGSNLAIISNNYKIPDDNPYGDGLVDLIDRMLEVNYKDRADMTEVIICLSALYAGKRLPKRKKKKKSTTNTKKQSHEINRVGSFRTNGQGIQNPVGSFEGKPSGAKKLDPNSAAARRKASHNENKTLDKCVSKMEGSEKKNMSSMDAFDAAFELDEDLFKSENNPFASFNEQESKQTKEDNFSFDTFDSTLPPDNAFDSSSVFSSFHEEPSSISTSKGKKGVSFSSTAISDDLFPENAFKFSAFPMSSLATKGEEVETDDARRSKDIATRRSRKYGSTIERLSFNRSISSSK